MLAYVDTSIWILYVEGLPDYQNAVETRLEQLKQEGWCFCASQAVMMETLYKPYRENNPGLTTVYIDLFKKTKNLYNYTELFEDGLRIMQSETLKAMDSLHVALAAHYGCERFITTDADFRNLQTVPVLLIDLLHAS